ncbi:MAG: hypothetical protein WC972_13320 [Trueperaceae bacterium]
MSPAPRPPKADRIRTIVGLMAAGRWVTGVTGPNLASVWGLHVGTLEKDAAEASRIVRATVANNEDIRARAVLTFESIQGLAMDKGDLRVALDAARALVGVADLETPRKLEVTGRDGAPVLGGVVIMPPEKPLDDGAAAADPVAAAPGTAD